MSTRLDEVMAILTAARERMVATVGDLSSEQWSQHARDGGWTIAEIVGHVHLAEAGSLRALFRALRDAKRAGLGPEASRESVARSMDHFAIVDSPQRRAAPEFTVPRETLAPDALLAHLARNGDGFRLWATEAHGFALGTVSFPHAAFGTITLYQWVLFLAHHAERHVRQISAILEESRR